MKPRTMGLVVLVLCALAFVLLHRPRPPDLIMAVHTTPSAHAEPETSVFGDDIRKLRDAHRYAELDAMAAALREHDSHFTGGISKLDRFYWALVADAIPTDKRPCATRLALPTQFDTVHALLEDWRSLAPSTTVNVALARFWQAAYDAAGYCQGPWHWTPEEGQAINDRELRIIPYLKAVDITTDPEALWLAMRFMAFYNYPRWSRHDLFETAVSRFPDFYLFYAEWGSYLASLWDRNPHPLDVYLQELRRPSLGDTGKVAYAFVTYRLVQRFARNKLFTEVGLSFAGVVDAYQARERLYGLRDNDWNVVFDLSIEALDCETAHTAYLHIGDHWDPAIWGERKYFDQTVAWYHAHSVY